VYVFLGEGNARLILRIADVLCFQNDTVRVLEEVKQLGVTVAIDDFGTGFSSLSQLRRLKVDRLKIDRAFVQEAQASEAGATIAMMVVNLGRSLGLTVIAEGIETEEQRQHLLNLGCHEGQGWLFARPQPAEQLEAWLAQEGERAAAAAAAAAPISVS
jgi:EAL domain-containing protein (putative c-di-GMP-specific phosphodiesterase class I)